MKTKYVFGSLLILALMIIMPYQSKAQFGKLKDKLKKTTGNNNSPVNNNPVKTKSSSEIQAEKANKLNKKIGEEKIAELMAYYKPKYYAVRDFPPASNIKEGLYIDYCDKKSTYLTMFETANWPSLKARMEQDKAAYPELFKYYGMEDKSGRYGEMEYGWSTNNENPKPFSGDLESVNNYIKEIYEWRASISQSQKGMAMTVQKLINMIDQTTSAKQFDCALNAVKMARAIKQADPDNPMIDDMVKDAEAKYNQFLTTINNLMTGKFHKDHLKDAVVFSKKQTIGQESASDITTTITAGEPAYIIGYFAATNKSGGGLASLGWSMVTEDKPADKAATEYAAEYYQTMYQNGDVKAKLEPNAYMTFELFPDPASLNYKSHLQYIPHLNFAKWVTMQMPGTYQMVFRWGKTNVMATSSVITLNITKEGRDKAKEYYNTFMQKKIAAVTFPGACTDQRAQVTNISDLSKYGTLLKISMSKTGDIMFPWPNDHKVQWNTANGWGAFETADGKVEVINLEFRKEPSATKWQWWSVGTLPSDYELTGKDNIKPERLNFGYEMTKAKVNTCEGW